MILMDFGSPSGDHFGSLFHIICDLKCTKACLDCMHEFWWFLIGNLVIFDGPTSQKYGKHWCLHEISLFRLFRYFDDFRYLLGPHFGHFSRSWDTILMIFGCIGHALKFHWFSGPTQVETMDLVDGKLSIQGVQYTINNHQIADLQDIRYQIPHLLMEYWKELRIECWKAFLRSLVAPGKQGPADI